MKVVINSCYGGFGLSKEAMVRYCEIKNIPCWIVEDRKYGSLGLWTCWVVPTEQRVQTIEGAWSEMSTEERIAHNKALSKQTLYDRDIARDDPALVQVVEELGKKAAGRCADLRIVEVPNDVAWEVEEYDGKEWVAEVHRTWS